MFIWHKWRTTSLDHPTLHFCRMKAARQTRRSLLGTNTTCWLRLSGIAKLSGWVLATSLGLGWSQLLSRTEILTGLCKLISASRVTPWIQWEGQRREVTYTFPEHMYLRKSPTLICPLPQPSAHNASIFLCSHQVSVPHCTKGSAHHKKLTSKEFHRLLGHRSSQNLDYHNTKRLRS